MAGRRGVRLLAAWASVCALTGQALTYSTSAASAVLMEQSSGRVIYQHAAEEERLIASITKIMTAVVALEQGDLRTRYTVTGEDMAEGSSMYLKPGETVTLEELLYGLMLSSGNDAALAVAHCVAGSLEDFVALMNSKARELGMEHSGFRNPNGLDAPGHRSSAADMAKLTAYALENEDFRRIVSTSTVTIEGRTLTNHNKLLRLYRGCIGVKTGYTKAAGRTLVSAAERDGMTLICVTLSDGNDWNDHMALYDEAFSAYRMERVAPAGQGMGSIPVSGGTVRTVPLVLDRELCYPVTGEETLSLRIRIPAEVPAPVVPGQRVGMAIAVLEGREVARVDLVAAGAAAAEAEEKEDRGRG